MLKCCLWLCLSQSGWNQVACRKVRCSTACEHCSTQTVPEDGCSSRMSLAAVLSNKFMATHAVLNDLPLIHLLAAITAIW